MTRRKPARSQPILRCAAVAAATLLAPAPPARAAGTFTVTTANDSGPASLRQAILDANAAGGGTVNMTLAGPIFLFGPLPIISTPITINGGNGTVFGNNV